MFVNVFGEVYDKNPNLVEVKLTEEDAAEKNITKDNYHGRKDIIIITLDYLGKYEKVFNDFKKNDDAVSLLERQSFILFLFGLWKVTISFLFSGKK